LWERREKRAERVARGRNVMISLRIPSGPEVLPVPSELIVLSNVSRVIMSASMKVESPRGSMKTRSELSRVFPRRDGKFGRGGAGEFGLED
jgi:hypothetical protein